MDISCFGQFYFSLAKVIQLAILGFLIFLGVGFRRNREVGGVGRSHLFGAVLSLWMTGIVGVVSGNLTSEEMRTQVAAEDLEVFLSQTRCIATQDLVIPLIGTLFVALVLLSKRK